MTIAYIAHPISGDVVGNIQKILSIIKEINLTKPNVVPFVPYLADLLALDDNDPKQRKRGIKNGLAIIQSGLIDELLIYGPRISSGMEAEILVAHSMDIPVIIMTSETEVPDWLIKIISPVLK